MSDRPFVYRPTTDREPTADEALEMITEADLTVYGRDYLIGWLVTAAPGMVPRALAAMRWYETTVDKTGMSYFKVDDDY